MNKEVERYIKYVKKLIPIRSKDKKEFIKLLTEQINEFANEKEHCTYQDIVDEFGTPNEVAGSYIENVNSKIIVKNLNNKRIIKIVFIILIVLCISAWGFERYRLIQLLNEAGSMVKAIL